MNKQQLSSKTLFQLPSLLKQLGFAGLLASGLISAQAQTATATKPSPAALELKLVNHGSQILHVKSVLVMGAKEAILLDAGFTRADALRVLPLPYWTEARRSTPSVCRPPTRTFISASKFSIRHSLKPASSRPRRR